MEDLLGCHWWFLIDCWTTQIFISSTDRPAVVNRERTLVVMQIWVDCPEVHRLEWEKQDPEIVGMVRKRNPNQEKLVLLGKQQIDLIFQYLVTRIVQHCLELWE